jgi:hypothetical protein
MESEKSKVNWISTNLFAQNLFLGLSLVAIALWSAGIPMSFAASNGGENLGIGLFITSCAVGLILWISTFTTIDRLRAIAESLPDEISDMRVSHHLKSNPWFAFAALITTVHVGVLVGHGIVLLG